MTRALWVLAASVSFWSFGFTTMRGSDLWWHLAAGRAIWESWAWPRTDARRGALVVCLVPARTDTRWWHDYATKGEIRFLRGRLCFQGSSKSMVNAPFPSAIVVFRPPLGLVEAKR